MATDAATTTNTYGFTANTLTLLCKRYLHHGPDYPECPDCASGAVPKHACDGHHETIDQFLDRVSFGVPEYRALIEQRDFMPNSPTLFNAGLRGTLSACFTLDVADTMENEERSGILDVHNRAARILKWGGGVGYWLGDLRARGARVASTHGVAMGPTGVLQHYQSLGRMMTQGGKREGAQIAIIGCDHPDVREFIHVKDEDPDAYETFNISVALTDEFMQRAASVSPDDDMTCEEAELLREMAESAWRTGDPGVFFPDTVNAHDPTPWAGRINGANPCGEVPQRNNEACTLGSINLGHFITNGSVDWGKLKRVTETAIRYLDDVIEHDWYPDPEITKAVQRTRKLGLGVCGWADTLALMRIPYASNKARALAELVAETIGKAARDASLSLSAERGPAPVFLENDAPALAPDGGWPRNSTRTCIAPTGTIAILMDASSGIEPYFALDNSRMMGDGTVLAEHANGNGPDFTPEVAHDIPWEWHVRHQAAWQEHTDLAVSKTINLPNDATVDDILAAFIEMWRSGCKGGTVYRDGSREKQVLQTVEYGVDMDAFHTIADNRGLLGQLPVREPGPLSGDVGVPHVHHRRDLPTVREARTRKVRIADQRFYMTVGRFEDGQPGELFIDLSRQGSQVSGWCGSWAKMVSYGLQYGVPLDALVHAFANVHFEPFGLTNDPELPTATSPVDYAVRRLALDYGQADAITAAQHTGMVCPDCGKPAIAEEGCLKCSNGCGWTQC